MLLGYALEELLLGRAGADVLQGCCRHLFESPGDRVKIQVAIVDPESFVGAVVKQPVFDYRGRPSEASDRGEGDELSQSAAPVEQVAVWLRGRKIDEEDRFSSRAIPAAGQFRLAVWSP